MSTAQSGQRQVLLALIEDILRDVINDATINLREDTSAYDVDGWDSLAHISLINALESECHIRFALGELDEIRNVGELIDSILRKQG